MCPDHRPSNNILNQCLALGVKISVDDNLKLCAFFSLALIMPIFLKTK